MFVHAVKKALDQNRKFSTSIKKTCESMDSLLSYLPQLFKEVDMQLFDGAIHSFFKRKKIKLVIKQSTKGPAGVTTYNLMDGMQIHLNKHAWLSPDSTGMVGGNLCSRADTCLIQTFLHEIVHVILFCIYIELHVTQKEAEALIPTHFDPTHNIIFTKWLKQFFNQDTIDNSLLLRATNSNKPLEFHKTVEEIEHTCLATMQTQLSVFYQGTWQPATMSKNQTHLQPHHSRIQTAQNQKLIVPNGLLSC